ncbi:amino acid adenylation domain-containing protein [Streptomyces sp. M54]|uniref:amino acid adenylation domain-containing protein n=1 Tax=Streptomyces sp. M54 TaxID=2759525 RepID=UPI001FB13A77|nr:amino acid adenylation domain-containing protein [Streptomyces sp. M54]
MPGAQCHAVRVAVTGTDVRGLRDRLAAAGPWRLWTDDIPGAATGPIAVRRRASELRRPVRGDVRCVLLRYGDGTADLVVVAHRDRLDGPGLHHLVAVLTGERPPSPAPHPAAPRAGLPPVAAAPDWGGGDPSSTAHAACHVDLPLPHATAPAALRLPALAVTLARYDGHGATAAATVGTDDRGAREYALPASATLRDLAGAEPAHTAQGVVAGILDAGSGPLADERLPCLAPPFPLTFVFSPLPDGATRLSCHFRLSHVASAVAEGFTRHLAQVYRQAVLAPDTAVADVELLDRDERDRVARLGRPAAGHARTPDTLPRAFARVAAAAPNAIALCDGGTELSYRELDERSARIAAGLRARGVRRGDRVGVCLERSAELVVTLLGVVRAGASYVPTDPAYPTGRLAHTVADAGLRVVVTRLAEFPREGGAVPLTPDELTAPAPAERAGTAEDGPDGATEDGAAPLPPDERTAPATAPPERARTAEGGTEEPEGPDGTTAPDDPAYVIYTSGSTGRPKGVTVPHRNVVALIDATRDEYGLGPDDTWTLFHSAAFDFSVWEIWGCLLTGGRLVVVPYAVTRDPDEFRDLLLARRVTVLGQTPSAFSQLLRTDHTGLPVRLVVFGGEPLDSRMLLPWFDRHPETTCRTVNMFGITETTVHVTAQTVTRELALAGSRSVGPALPGWHLYVTDERGRLVPPGVTGEIRVGGAGVAAGYLNRPELTAERFLPDPYAPDARARAYRSGDLGRLRTDGRLEHLGRIDSQVKIRGFRIEPDEIRAVLLEDPAVTAAAVVVHRDDPADPATARLDAYVVPAGGTAADLQGLRKRAAGILPEHMVPATVTALDALPLTPNGKLDATRLPAPVRSSSSSASSSARPAPEPDGTGDTALADALREIWETVLGTPVGLDDDFFELGGNSLFAVRISAALRARGLKPVPLRDLFRTPTIRELTT